MSTVVASTASIEIYSFFYIYINIVLGSYKHVHLDSCAAFPVWSSLSFYSTSSSRKCLVGTRVKPVVYVHSRHLQLRGDAAILIKLFSLFLQALGPNSNKILIFTTCILNKNICLSIDDTHILVLKLQLIIFDLFRDYKSFVSGRSPALCLPSLASSFAGWTAWFQKSENSSMDRTQFYAIVKQIEPFHRVVTD